MHASRRRQSADKPSRMRNMRGRIGSRRQDARQLGAQETQPLPHRDASLQQEGADLVDAAGTLIEKPLAHPVQGLQVELVGTLGRDKLHGWAVALLRRSPPHRGSRSSALWHTAAQTSPASAERCGQARRGRPSYRSSMGEDWQVALQPSHAITFFAERSHRADPHPRRENEFLSMTVISELRCDMACSLSSVPQTSFHRWRAGARLDHPLADKGIPAV